MKLRETEIVCQQWQRFMKTHYKTSGAALGKERVRKDPWIWGGWSKGIVPPVRSSALGPELPGSLVAAGHRWHPDAAQDGVRLLRRPRFLVPGTSSHKQQRVSFLLFCACSFLSALKPQLKKVACKSGITWAFNGYSHLFPLKCLLYTRQPGVLYCSVAQRQFRCALCSQVSSQLWEGGSSGNSHTPGVNEREKWRHRTKTKSQVSRRARKGGC